VNEALLQLVAAALSGVASRPRGGHGTPVRSAADVAAEAVELARATLDALEEQATEPTKPTRKR
jgi:hypothetical protein